jgi:hypothetical protein
VHFVRNVWSEAVNDTFKCVSFVRQKHRHGWLYKLSQSSLLPVVALVARIHLVRLLRWQLLELSEY